MDLTPTNEPWCIEDTLFYPFGLINHTTGNKTVFVTWSDKCLMNFIFKKVAPSTNRCNKFMIKVPEEIVDIIILETNTLVLLQNGEVYYFSSIKSIHRIPWLNSGVRCISSSIEGFSLIRIVEDKRIKLEIYEDIQNVGKNRQNCIRSFDLSFDELNLFDSDWSDERITLTSIGINDGNGKFMELLIGDMNLKANEVHIFTISNSLFALYGKGEEDYEIKTLAPQVSYIELVKFLEDINMLLIFLNCGIIEVFYMSKIAWVMERYTYVNGSEFIHHIFAGGFLYFTDGQRVGRLKFAYDIVEHACQVTEQSLDAPGMVAITYEKVSGSLVCLSNNNVFYHLSFEGKQQSEEEIPEDNHLFELTDEKFSDMMSKSYLLKEINSMPEKIDQLIEKEYQTQELIAVCRKSTIYSELITAEISFSQHIPETEEKLIYPTNKGIPPFTYFAVVSLKILSHEIFKSSVWKVMIAFSDHVKLLSLTPDLLEKRFSILIPIQRNNNELIPEFDLQILTYVNLEQDFVCIKIPVKIANMDLSSLFSRNQGLKACGKKSQYNDSPFFFKAIASELHSDHIYKLFGLSKTKDIVDLELDPLIVTLYFLGEKVSVSYAESRKEIAVESSDPVAIYYAKRCISKYFWDNFQQKPDNHEDLRNILLDLQCQIEKRYGALCDKELHFANLKRIYEKLRMINVWKF